jgi:DNA-binding response OmpR family regulator
MEELQYKILVVDDDPAVVESLEACYNGELYSAGSIKEARDMLKKNRPDMVILDRRLPDGDGLEICVEIRKDPQYSSLPVLMLTAKVELCDKVLGFRLGADDYLTKPFRLEELKARVEALFQRCPPKAPSGNT